MILDQIKITKIMICWSDLTMIWSEILCLKCTFLSKICINDLAQKQCLQQLCSSFDQKQTMHIFEENGRASICNNHVNMVVAYVYTTATLLIKINVEKYESPLSILYFNKNFMTDLSVRNTSELKSATFWILLSKKCQNCVAF